MDFVTIVIFILMALGMIFVVPKVREMKVVKFIDNFFFWLGFILLIILLFKFCSAAL